MQTESNNEIKNNLVKILNFFNLGEESLVFDKDFNIYLVCLRSDRFFDADFCKALETLIHQINPKEVFLKVDLNNHFTKTLASIKDEVNTVVNQAKYYNQPIAIKSKNAFERRLKHLYIDNNYKNIKHESVGLGDERQIVIYPN